MKPLSEEMLEDLEAHPEYFAAEGRSWGRWAAGRVMTMEARIEALEKKVTWAAAFLWRIGEKAAGAMMEDSLAAKEKKP